MFLYDGHLYQKIDGLSMGSPLASILANWFVAMIEDKLLNNPNVKQPKFYKRYVDDIFAVFHCEADKNEFYTHLNSAHNNLKFTMENMSTSSNSLPFLDVNIRKTTLHQFETSVYQKPTNTGVLLNYEAVAPEKWKQSIIKCFLTRAKRISSSEELFNKEINCIRDLFHADDYPKSFINNTVEDFFRDENKRAQVDGNKSSLIENITAKQAYFVLPYIGKVSEKLHRRVKKEFLAYNINLKSAYRTTKVGSYLSLKQPIPRLFKSCVVYEFKCPLDKDIRYIGETERHIFERIVEHCSITSTEKPKPSAIRDHILRCNTCASATNIAENFSIMRTCTKFDVLSQEALHIKKFKPSLNIQLGPYRGSRVPSNIFS